MIFFGRTVRWFLVYQIQKRKMYFPINQPIFFLLFQILGYRQNLLTRILHLNPLYNLREIDFHDNQITHIENLDSLVNLE